MKGEIERAFRTVFRFGSVTELSVPFLTGRPKLVEPIRRCTLGLSTYVRNWAHAGCGAFQEHAKPSPPPSSEPGRALLPGTFGNGNQPRKLGTLLSGVRDCITPGFQCPWSSIAALPFATSPAELDAPCCAGVARNPFWNGPASSSCWRYAPAFVQQPLPKLYVTADDCITALLQSFVAR